MQGDYYFNHNASLVRVMSKKTQGTSKILQIALIYGDWPGRAKMLDKIAGARVYCGAWFLVPPRDDVLTCSIELAGCD